MGVQEIIDQLQEIVNELEELDDADERITLEEAIGRVHRVVTLFGESTASEANVRAWFRMKHTTTMSPDRSYLMTVSDDGSVYAYVGQVRDWDEVRP